MKGRSTWWCWPWARAFPQSCSHCGLPCAEACRLAALIVHSGVNPELQVCPEANVVRTHKAPTCGESVGHLQLCQGTW